MNTQELIQFYYAAFNHGDRAATLALLTEDVIHDLNQGSREVGLESFRAFFERMDRSYSEKLHDIAIMVSTDQNRAAAEYVVHGNYIADDQGLPSAIGQSYILPGGAFFSVRGGKIARVSNYYNLTDWIAQVSRHE